MPSLIDANLSGANLNGTDLNGADLSHADIWLPKRSHSTAARYSLFMHKGVPVHRIDMPSQRHDHLDLLVYRNTRRNACDP